MIILFLIFVTLLIIPERVIKQENVENANFYFLSTDFPNIHEINKDCLSSISGNMQNCIKNIYKAQGNYKIVSYDIANDKIILSESSDTSTYLKVINLSGTVIYSKYFEKTVIWDIAYSNYLQQVFFLEQNIDFVKADDRDYFEQIPVSDSKIVSSNLVLSKFSNELGSEIYNPTRIALSKKENFLLVQNVQLQGSLYDPHVGKIMEVGIVAMFDDTNFSGNKILMTNFNSDGDSFLEILSANAKKQMLDDALQIEVAGVSYKDAVFMNESDDLFWVKEYFNDEESRQLYDVEYFDGEKVTSLNLRQNYSLNIFSFEMPRLGEDGLFLFLEKYELKDIHDFENARIDGFQGRPNNAKLVVYNLESRRIVGEIEGLEVRME